MNFSYDCPIVHIQMLLARDRGNAGSSFRDEFCLCSGRRVNYCCPIHHLAIDRMLKSTDRLAGAQHFTEAFSPPKHVWNTVAKEQGKTRCFMSGNTLALSQDI